ncbi:hypothetical protein AAMO2058_000926500 [Amorphochlora amoebiformis]
MNGASGEMNMSIEEGDGMDILAGLNYLFSTKHKGVREYVIEKLDSVPNHDFEFYLPQLCHLYSNMKPSEGSGLLDLIASRCAKYPQICLKTVLLLRSAAKHGKSTQQTQRYTELWRACESAFVTAKIPPVKMHRSRSFPKLEEGRECRVVKGTHSLETLVRDNHFGANGARKKTKVIVDEEEEDTKRVTLIVPPNELRNSTNSTTPLVRERKSKGSESEQDAPGKGQNKENKISPLPDAQSADTATSAFDKPDNKKSSCTSAASPSLSFTPQMGTQATPGMQELNIKKLKVHAVARGRTRREFLQSELQLLADFSQISEMLLKVRRKARNDCLRACLTKLNRKIPVGIYIPFCTVDGDHFVIRRFVPSAARSLNSRDKAPYMLFIEIIYTGKKCGDEDIYSIDVPRLPVQESKSSSKDGSKGSDLQLSSIVDSVIKEYGYKFTGSQLMECIRKLAIKIVKPPALRKPPIPEAPTGKNTSAGESNKAAEIDLETLSRQLASNLLASRLVVPSAIVNPKKSPSRRDLSVFPKEKYIIAGGQQTRSQPVSEAKVKGGEAVDPFGRPWKKRKARFQQESPIGGLKNWDIVSVIYKAGDDLRQEVLAMQLIKICDTIFNEAGLPLQLSPYEVIVTSPDSGLIETIHNAASIHGLKEDWPNFTSLSDFFEGYFGQRGTTKHEQAQRNFVESMAAYSLVTYLFAIKDRHNGNIMMDREGRIIHIDFGFMLNNSPGGNSNFESSPFKLTQEYVEVMEGEDSKAFAYFKLMFIRGLLELRKHYHKFELAIKITMQNSLMACFAPTTITDLQSRFGLGMRVDFFGRFLNMRESFKL